MRGRNILILVVLGTAALVFFAVKPTDSDLRRSLEKVNLLMDQLEKELADLHPALVFLRQQKRRTFKLDGEQEALRKKTSLLRKGVNAAVYNIENLTPRNRQATVDALADLDLKANKQLSAVSLFGNKVRALHRFVKEGFPLLGEVEALQTRMNQIAEARNKQGAPLTGDRLKDLESYNMQCGQIQKSATQAMTTLHSHMEQGRILSETTINSATKLIPTLEAFIEDLE